VSSRIKWHLDNVTIRIPGVQHYLSRVLAS
jgi:transposase-like protein